MCGIAGIVDSQGGPIGTERLRAMSDRLVHRGPDDEGFWRNPVAEGAAEGGPSCGLAFRRLSIIDVAGGRQPLCNEDRSLWLVFNGEIYNFPALRAELEARGHRFATRSDGETILHAYESFGIEGMLARLRGMFAFALWDQPRARLVLARDRVGKKPLVYCEREGRLHFASELGALLADPALPREPDWTALHHYLTFMCVPAPFTAFRGIKKLPPAHFLVREGGATRIERYWRLAYGPKLKLSRPEAAEALREKLLEATRLRLMSEVPLGAFLSGGIDSSSVVAAMSRAGGGTVKTFSIGFEEKKFNELPFARLVAAHYGTEHHEFMVRPNALEVLPELVRHYGEPYADSSAIPTFFLSRLTRQHVTVALNGDGGDESFTGYRRHYAGRIADRFHALPAPLRQLGRRTLERLAPRPHDRQSLLAGFRRFAEAAELPRHERHARWTGYFTEPEKRRLLAPEPLAALDGVPPSSELLRPYFEEGADLDGAEAAVLADVAFYLPNDLLVKVDIATMAVSLEGRSPFLDHELMEFAARLPSRYKLRGRALKAILKEAVRPWLPREILEKPKWGFAIPIGNWFRGELKDFLADSLLSGPSAGGFFRKEEVERLIGEHQRGERDLGHHLWILLMFELWRREFLGGA